MIEEVPVNRPARRISPVARALRPVQQQIGQLQEATAFLVARNLYALRKPADRVTPEEIARQREGIATALALFEAAVEELPDGLRTDTRLRDTRAAIDRLSGAIDRLEEGVPD